MIRGYIYFYSYRLNDKIYLVQIPKYKQAESLHAEIEFSTLLSLLKSR